MDKETREIIATVRLGISAIALLLLSVGVSQSINGGDPKELATVFFFSALLSLVNLVIGLHVFIRGDK